METNVSDDSDIMKCNLISLLVCTTMLPSLALASEPPKGTLIIMGSVGGWVFITSGLMFYKETMRVRRERMTSEKDHQ